MKKLFSRIGAKLGGGIVIVIIGAAVAVMFAYQTARDFHLRTIGAWFPDDAHVLLARAVSLPFNSGRTIDVWRVALQDGKATPFGSEHVGAMHELYYLGVAQQRMWFWSSPSDTITSRGARSADDRYDVKKHITAHPTLSVSFDVDSFSVEGPVITDQRHQRYLVHANGALAATSSFADMRPTTKRNMNKDVWKYPALPLETSVGPGHQVYSQLPYVRPGVLLDPAGRPIRPREGGWLVVGEELTKGFDTGTKHVVIKLDDKGAVQWQLPLMKTFTNTTVDELSFGAHYTAVLRAMHTTPQRVWVVFELGTLKNGNHETRLVEIEATRGAVVRSIVPRL